MWRRLVEVDAAPHPAEGLLRFAPVYEQRGDRVAILRGEVGLLGQGNVCGDVILGGVERAENLSPAATEVFRIVPESAVRLRAGLGGGESRSDLRHESDEASLVEGLRSLLLELIAETIVINVHP